MTETSDPRVLEPGHLPTPFTADEIRAACPDGRTLVIRTAPAGFPTSLRSVVFAEGDAEGTVMVRTPRRPDGEPDDEPVRERMSWQELQSHGSYPADQTQVQEAPLKHPLGELECLVYTIDDGGGTVDRFWFDRSRPGLPIHIESFRGQHCVLEVTVVVDDMPTRA
ncbi:hypothetical protein JQN72_04815 [Phycicoccus sp. CSK15P-2]|uniref:hypothetical protein n=1 Tax=Phycicoccus sp. CSK15P-2 TaxID=2807627 RepID=UPI0019509E72|nr:hypothetical protein [Phycicoccus sp. CSK15P-2]MBM6403565.1 hypothetical protein [Phycicoccus sp. CSK15P-2]